MKKFQMSMLMTAVILGAVGNIVFAQDPALEETKGQLNEFYLDQVVVTATRTPVEAFKSNSNISVITKKDLENNHFRDLSDALRTAPGVYIGNYSLAGYDNANNFYINGSDSIVVLVDGVKINNAVNKVSPIQLKNLDNIERIEILKGSASTLYGSDAKGGVVNIITKRPDEIRTKIAASVGSYDNTNYEFNHEGKEKDWTWDVYLNKTLIGNFKDGEGVETPAHNNSRNASLKLTKKIGNHELIATYDSYQADYKYISEYETRPPYNYPVRNGEVNNHNYKFILNSKFDDTFENQLSFMNMDNYGNFNKYITEVNTKRVTDLLTKNFNDTNIVSIGYEFTQDTVDSFNGVKMTNRAVFIWDQLNIMPQLKLTAGLRHDNNSGFGKHNTPSVNLGYTFNKEKTNIYAGYSEYFIPPTPTQLYSAKYGNSNIKAETGETKEFGINHRFNDTLVGSAHVFWRNSTDRIGYSRVIGKYANVGDEKAHGWDVQLRKSFNKNVASFVSYTHTIVDETEQRTQNVDGYVPKGSVNVGVDYTNRGFNASLLGKGIIDRLGPTGPLGADAVENFFPATTYWVWDLSLNYQFSKSIRGFAKVNNIFDKFYAEHSNARGNWAGFAGEDVHGEWWRAPGRNFLVGLEYFF